MTDNRPTIAIMTSGGDAPGMNAAIQGAYCNASELGYRVLGIRSGFTGLLEGDLFQLQDGDVKNIIQIGGTILGTSRCEEFQKETAQKQAADYCRKWASRPSSSLEATAPLLAPRSLPTTASALWASRLRLTWTSDAVTIPLALTLP